MRNNFWIKFGCFITGYNYKLLLESGEASKKSLKKYTSALLIISIIWAANGFNFAKRYLDAGILGSIFSAIIMVIIVVQIERQIILTVRPKFWLKFFRTFLAILMAFIGSVIIDQILFNKDLDELRNENIRQNNSNEADYISTKNYDSLQIRNKTIELQRIDSNLNFLTSKISKSGGSSSVTIGNIDTVSGKVISTKGTKTDITPLIEAQKALIENKRQLSLSINDDKKHQEEAFLQYKKNRKSDSGGFFGEINLLLEFIKIKGALTWIIYSFWLVFFFVLEILVLVAKSTDEANDYERRVEYELDSNLKKINYLSNKSTKELS
jgi:hypothetical protein